MPTTDGTNEIDAWIMRPADFDPAQTYPTILNVHGGPHTQYGEIVLRGGPVPGGRRLRRADVQPARRFGPRGVVGAVDHGAQAPRTTPAPAGAASTSTTCSPWSTTPSSTYPFVDPARIGMQGGSYGGYMATWLAGTTGTKFKAHLQRAGGEQHVHRGVHQRHRHGVPRGARHGAHRRPRGVRADVADPLRARHRGAGADHPQRGRPTAARSARPRSCSSPCACSRKDVTFYRFPGESHELSRSGSPVHRCPARRDHPRLLRRAPRLTPGPDQRLALRFARSAPARRNGLINPPGWRRPKSTNAIDGPMSYHAIIAPTLG